MSIFIPVGTVTYSMRITRGWVRLDGMRCFGICDRDRLLIKISGPAPPAKRLAAAWHEIAHAWVAELAPGNYSQHLDEEGICDIIALAMSALDARLIGQIRTYALRGIEADSTMLLMDCPQPAPVLRSAPHPSG